MKELLFYTCCDERYHHFAAIYPLFARGCNPNCKVEIGVVNLLKFNEIYHDFIVYYEKCFPDDVRYTNVKLGDGHRPHTLRFLNQPMTRCQYVYIGDIDILVLESDIVQQHLRNISDHDLAYSNILRPNTDVPKLSGLHFIEYEKMYPLPTIELDGLRYCNDEHYLYLLMKHKGVPCPDKRLTFRPQHGIHCSINRPILPRFSLSYKKTDYLHWRVADYCGKYLKFSQSNYYQGLLNLLSPIEHLGLVQLIQSLELAVFAELGIYEIAKNRIRRKLNLRKT